MLCQTYLHENRVSDKTLGVQIAPLRQAKEMDWKKYAEDHYFWLNFAVQNLPFLAILGCFCHILDIFGPFLGRKNSVLIIAK